MTTIDDTVRRAAIERLLRFDADGTDHDLYHDDAVLEFPQSGERFEGLDNFREWRDQYPAEVTMRVRRISGSGDVWVGGSGELRRWAVDARRQRARVPRRTHRQREDLRHRAMDCPEWRATAPPSAGGGPAEVGPADPHDPPNTIAIPQHAGICHAALGHRHAVLARRRHVIEWCSVLSFCARP